MNPLSLLKRTIGSFKKMLNFFHRKEVDSVAQENEGAVEVGLQDPPQQAGADPVAPGG